MFFIKKLLIKSNVKRFNCFSPFFRYLIVKCLFHHLIFKGSKGVARENEGGDLQNLRSRDGFCKELIGWVGV